MLYVTGDKLSELLNCCEGYRHVQPNEERRKETMAVAWNRLSDHVKPLKDRIERLMKDATSPAAIPTVKIERM